MTLSIADQSRVVGRRCLLARAVEVLAAHCALAVHLFGSLARGGGDALSDLDLWATFPDAHLPGLVPRRAALYQAIGEVLIAHETPRNRPLGGCYSLVLHRTAAGLYHADYYLAPRATSVIVPEAIALYGDDTLPRGRWVLDEEARATESRTERVAFLTCMAFIGVKKILRGDRDFMPFLAGQYRRFVATHAPALAPIEDTGDLAALAHLLGQLALVATPDQRRAIDAIARDCLPPRAGAPTA